MMSQNKVTVYQFHVLGFKNRFSFAKDKA